MQSKSGYRAVTPATQGVRILIVVGMIAAAATFLHVNNYRPKQTFLSCDRPCHHLDWPMICRVKLTLEVFQSLSKSCGDCPHNETDCLAEHCVSADGQRRAILAANRQLPGPSIQVCENDILVVDVINRLPGKAMAVHWRGQSQVETPYMDGAPLVTQCPIPSYTTFQYKFRASAPGTHLWHAHAGADVTNGVFGSLIVRQADLRDPHRALYDIDDPNHVLLVSQWQHSPDSLLDKESSRSSVLLINGRSRRHGGPNVPFTTFVVVPGRRHRFRVANAAGAGSCPVTISVDSHPLLLITLDGNPLEPQEVTSITLAKGERADFILRASQRPSSYWINIHTSKECGANPISGAAILAYKSSPEEMPSLNMKAIDEGEAEEHKRMAMTTNPVEKCGNPEHLCITELRALRKLPIPLTKQKMDVTLYLPINYKRQANDFIGIGGMDMQVLSVNNVTFTYPSSPLLSQEADISPEVMCSSSSDDEGIENNDTTSMMSTSSATSPTPQKRCMKSTLASASDTCECVHVRQIPLGATVEIVLLDQGGLDDLVYHLHGNNFYVVGARKLSRSFSISELKDLDAKGQLFSRNLERAAIKDTVMVPRYSAVAIRFKADNPGYWMLRDEHAAYWTRGLDVVLQVGESNDIVPPPADFPKCGSFVGPEYFLI